MARRNYLVCLLAAMVAIGCRSKSAGDEEEAVAAEDIRTPVTVTQVETKTLTDEIDLNATSVFLQSSTVKASANGYITAINLKAQQYVNAGQLAFILKTKEAQALGNTINALDSSFRFSGMIRINTTTSGYVQQLNYKVGDYVQDGEQLAILTDTKSFGFILNVPYELKKFVAIGQSLPVVLPDSTQLSATVSSMLPNVDSISQTQQVFLKVNTTMLIPENLVVKVRIIKTINTSSAVLPKQAVLADESQENFWVMKMIDSITAVKVPIIKGAESGGVVEIKSPAFAPADKIILTGNYGLPDTAKVKITTSGE